MKEYDSNDIIVPNWPEMQQIGENRWQRVWHITLLTSQKLDTKLREFENEMSTNEVLVEATWVEKSLQVTVTTSRWGWDVDLIGYSYRVLSAVDEIIGEIKTIQGQPRYFWPPWSRKR